MSSRFLSRALNMRGAPGSDLSLSARMCRPNGIGGLQTGFPLADWALPSTGTLRVGVIFIDFDDAEAEYSTREEWEENFALYNEYVRANSYGWLRLEANVLHRWLRARGSYAEWFEESDSNPAVTARQLAQEAIDLAGVDLDFSNVDAGILVFPSQHFFGGSGPIGAKTSDGSGQLLMTSLNTFRDPTPSSGPSRWAIVTAHETMHLFGLADLNHERGYHYGVTECPPPGRVLATPRMGLMQLFYVIDKSEDDPGLNYYENGHWCSSTTEPEAREMLAWSRWQLGWLDTDAVACVTSRNATVNLAPVAAPGQGIAMAAVPISETELIVAESRRRIGYDQHYQKLDYASLRETPFTTASLPTEGVFIYTIDTSVPSRQMPIRVAGDMGDAIVDRWPIFTQGETVTIRGYQINVITSTPEGDTIRIRRQPASPANA